MSSTKSHVAVASNIPNFATSSQKNFNTEEPLVRQSSFGGSRKGNMKAKHLTRSHAMRESASPPRTPTPRADQVSQISPNEQSSNYQQQEQPHHSDGKEMFNNNSDNKTTINNSSNSSTNNGNGINTNKLQTQSTTTRGNSPIIETPTVIVTSQHKQQQQLNVVLCNEAEFPKLSPPKSSKCCGSASLGPQQRIGTTGVDSTRIECNNNNHNSISSSSIKNPAVEVKLNSNDTAQADTHKNSNQGTNNGTSHDINHNQTQQQQYQYNASSALHQALNVAENTSHYQQNQLQLPTQQLQDTTLATQTTAVYNAGMNYQLPGLPGEDQHQQYVGYDKENRCPRNDSQNSSRNSNDERHYEQPQRSSVTSGGGGGSLNVGVGGNCNNGGGGGNGGKKHRTNSNSKGSKPRLKNIGSGSGGGGMSSTGNGGGSIGSVEGSLHNSNNTSGFISRVFNNSENSNEQYTDHGGTDLLSFFKETLNKNIKDRQILLKIEKDLIEFAQDESRTEMRFPSASSYNRMLIHRTAAFFGMEHNVDTETQQCVIVAPTKNTRIPEIRFKSLVVNHRDDARKSILKRDTHSFDDTRQSGYLCPDRGMLDRKAKSFEEREEDYERARSRIFNRTQNGVGGCSGINVEDDNYICWTSSVEQQQQQQQLPINRSSRANGKVLKIQNSPELREGRTGSAVAKAHSFGGYGQSSNQGGNGDSGASGKLLRGDSINSNKNVAGSGRIFSKQDSLSCANTPWRLSPSSSSGTVYQFDPTNLPPAQAVAGGAYHPSPNASSQQQTHGMPRKQKPHQMTQQQQQKTDCTADMSESSTQTSAVGDIDVEGDCKSLTSTVDANYQDESPNQHGRDECDNINKGCLNITTTTSTKSYDRIEVQKFKNQATSPNIPQSDKNEVPKLEPSSRTSANVTPQSQQQQQQQQQQQSDTPLSARSTPFSSSDTIAKRTCDDVKTTTWTPSYQTSDGSTAFHTTATPNGGSPYCPPTYQQAPDGSIYAVQQSMIYPYPPPVEGDLQGYFMPVFDPSQQRTEPSGLIAAGTHTIFPAGATAAMVPVAAAYPAAQFATTNGTAVYPGQVIYSSEQFTAGGALAATATGSASGQLQHIPITTYPVGYPYPYNGYWGQAMTYYVPQQTLASAVTATSLLPTPQIPPPPPSAPTALSGVGTHVAGGVTLNGHGHSTAGPSPSSTLPLSNSCVSTVSGNHVPMSNSGNYQTHNSGGGSGTTYFGTGRVKRAPAPHYGAGQSSSHQLVTATAIPNGVGAATYQLSHTVPTLAIAATAASPAAANATAPPNDLSNNGASTAATMYALPQHAAIFPTNMFSYAAATTATAGTPGTTNATPQAAIVPPPPTTQQAVATANNTTVVHSQQSNAVITPFFAAHHAHRTLHAGSAIHAPGPAAIPFIDPVTLANFSQGPSSSSYVGGNNNNAPLSAPSTPHSLPSAMLQSQRNPSLFSTPPMMNTGGGSFCGSNSTPQYYVSADQQHQGNGGVGSNSPPNSHGSSYDRRSSGANGGGGKKSFNNGGHLNRQNAVINAGYNSNSKPPLLGSNSNESSNPLASNGRQLPLKRSGNEKSQLPLLSGPASYAGNLSNSYQSNANADTVGGCGGAIMNVPKPSLRLNAAAASFRQKSSNNTGSEFRRNVSQRNSPCTNSSSNENSNNNSPNSNNTSSNAATPVANCYTPSYVFNSNVNESQQCTVTATPSLYLASRGSAHIPSQLHHSGGASIATTAMPTPAAVTNTGPQQTVTAMLGEAANAAMAHHQPLLGTYNPGTSGVYFKYGHTYFAHPPIALPNNRRSPSTELRPSMAQVAGMYPTVNMMIPAQPRHAQGRHLNPNYKGTRPR